MNYSASGLSGSDGPDGKPSGTFSTDPETRDFMMSRFLPAAKAMALEPHRYASRKQDMPPEQPKQVKRVVSEDRRPLVNQNKLDIIPLYGQNKDEEESEDEEDDHDNSGNNSAKGCGLFPSLRLKNSLCLLSPVPGIGVRTQGSASSTRDTLRPGKTAYSRSHTQTTRKHAWGAVHDSKPDYGVRSAELQKVEKKQTGESSRFTRSGELHKVDKKQTGESSRFTRSGELQKVDKKQTGESSRFTRSGELQTTGRFSPYRGSGGAGVSPYRNKASQSPFRGARFLGVPKEVENIKTNKFNLYVEGTNKNKQGSGSMSPAVEKTLYVDTVNTAEISLSNSRSLETKGWIYSSGEDLETSLEGKMFEETTNAESVFQDIKCLNISTEGDVLESFVSVDADLSSMSEISHLKGQDVMMDGSGQDQGLDKRSRSLECSKPITEGNLNIDSDQIHKADDPGNADSSSVNSNLPPALPKSPSESWLWRTLPSISSRNLFSHSNLGTHKHLKKHDSKTSSTNTKWETIVKTSHLRHDHVRYSEELITHVSQQSKT
ncbi:uncharacterized protein LOC132170830 [Corylus avellana]|uniref:uncharacterized protein LOC132170830 n=1 Tax=Corylus avellana TaxID=13451 RepID=UPI00286B1A1F|nr:uncharacterized protein LOC132170830 [Corylus avellana]